MKMYLKKAISLFLAFIMIFGASAAGIAGIPEISSSSEAQAETAENSILFKTEIFKYGEISQEWIEADKVVQGEKIKVRVYAEPSYYTGSGQILYFYDNSFFEDDYEFNTKYSLNVKPNYWVEESSVFCKYNSQSAVIKNLVANGYISQEFADTHNAYAIVYFTEYENSVTLTAWIGEFDLRVKEDAAGESSFTVVPETVISPERTNAYIDIPVGERGVSCLETVSLSNVSGLTVENEHPTVTVGNTSEFIFFTHGGILEVDGIRYNDFYRYTATVGEPFEIDQIPYMEGNYFNGWRNLEGEAIELPETVPSEDFTFYPSWEPREHCITIYAEGGEFPDSTVVKSWWQEYGTRVILDLPEREGMNLAGWVTEYGEEYVGMPNLIMPDYSFELHAKWEPQKYFVNFDAYEGTFSDGTDYFTAESEYQGEITPPDSPEKEGYTFAGWFPAIPDAMPAEDVFLEAVWVSETPESYNVNYSFEGNVPEAAVIPESTVNETGSEVTLPAVTEIDGYVFKGWYCNGIAVDSVLMQNRDVEIVGKWDYSEFTVNYEYTEPVPTDVTLPDAHLETVGSTVTVAEVPEVEGYTFDGWYYKGMLVTDFVMPDSDVTLTGTWVPDSYRLFIDNGDYIYTDEYYYYGQEIENLPIPVKEGYVFLGWVDEYGEYVDVPRTMPAHDLYLSAVWEICEYDLILDANGGKFIDGNERFEAEACYGDDISSILPAYPTKEDFLFEGWADADGKIITDLPSAMPAEDITLTAVWSEVTYTVTFDANGGEWADGSTDDIVKTYSYGETIEVPEFPTMEQASFIGWANSSYVSATVPKTMPRENLIFHAKWTTDDTLSFRTEIYRYDEAYGEWVVTETVKPGEQVKARVFIDTAYAAGDGDVLLFFDNEFFEANVSNSNENSENIYELAVNTDESSSAAMIQANGQYKIVNENDRVIQMLVEDGYISNEFALTHSGIMFTFQNGTRKCTRISGEQWFAEFDLIVKENAQGSGDVFVNGDTVTDPYDKFYAYTNIYVGAEGQNTYEALGMYDVMVSTYIESRPVSTQNTIIFDANGGSFGDTIGTQQIVSGTVGEPFEIPTPTNDGYNFMGWSEFEWGSYENFVENLYVMPYESVTYYAIWESAEVTYSIEIYYMDAEGNYGYPEVITAGALSYNEVIFDVNNVPDGFSVDEENSILSGVVLPDSSLVLSVYLMRNIYKISYYTDDYLFMEQNYYYGEEVYDVPLPSKNYHDFDCWLYENGETVTIPFYMPAEDLTLTAKWDAHEYYVGYYLAEGSEAYQIDAYEFGAQINHPEAPSVEGMSFVGWFDEWGFEPPETMGVHEIKLYAKYEVDEYTVTFRNEDNTHAAYLIPYGAQIPVPEAPEKEGYVFTGWSPSIPDIMPAHDIEIYAVWEAVEYTVTYKVGSKTVTETYSVGEEINEPDFGDVRITGWIDESGNKAEIPDTMPAKNLVFTAKFKYVSKSDKCDVTAEFGDGCFGRDVKISVEDLTGENVSTGNSGSGNFNSHERNENGNLAKPVGFYNIKMIDESGASVQPNDGEKVTIRMKIPDSYINRTDFMIYHWFTTGGREVFSTRSAPPTITREGNYLIFETSGFSNFALYAVSEAEVVNAPSKVNYKGSLDLSGMELKITNADGSVETVTDTSKMQIIGFDSSEIGDQTVTVEYEGHCAEFEVNVSYAWWQWIIRILLLGFLWY